MPPDGPGHDDCSEPVRDYLGAYRLAHLDLVEEVVSEAWVRVDAGTDRIGDIGVFLVGQRSAVERPERVPELMFEIVSPGRKSANVITSRSGRSTTDWAFSNTSFSTGSNIVRPSSRRGRGGTANASCGRATFIPARYYRGWRFRWRGFYERLRQRTNDGRAWSGGGSA